MKALSIRQPWAWLIVNGYKDIENRSWPTRHRGPVLIHASKGMTRRQYDDCREIALAIDRTIPFPKFEDLQRGGIVGAIHILDCVTDSASPWYAGEQGFVLSRPLKIPFHPCKGRLGFFNVETPSL